MKEIKMILNEEQYLNLIDTFKDIDISATKIKNKYDVSIRFKELNSDYRVIAKKESDITTLYENRDLSKFDNCGCEHCNIKRFRETLYIIENKNTNELKQVGRNCLKNYIGENIKAIKEFDNISETIDNINDSFKDSKYKNIASLFYKGNKFIKEFGYADKFKLREHISKIKSESLIDEELFNEFRNFYINLKNCNTFLINCQEIAKVNYIKDNKIGIFTWMLQNFFEHYDKNEYDFYGNEGDKIKNGDLIVKSIQVNWKINYYSYYQEKIPEYVLIVKDKNDNEYLMIHNASSEIPYKEGSILKQFTIKSHKEFNGLKKTFINRVKLGV